MHTAISIAYGKQTKRTVITTNKSGGRYVNLQIERAGAQFYGIEKCDSINH